MKENGGKSTLDRYLSRFDVWALSLGCIIGWGAFVMPGTTFLPLAGPGGTLIAMAVSTAVTLVIAYNYFSLMRRYPGTGGVYAYSKELFGRDHAFLSSWFLCLAYVSLIPQNATILSLICRILTGDAFRNTPGYSVAGTTVYLSEILIALAILILIGLFAICMKPFLQWVQTILGIVLVAGIITIAVLVTPHVRPDTLFSSFGTMGSSPFRGILSIVILAPWAFVGFEVVSLETAHFRFPVKKAGKLIGLAVLMGGCIYAVLAVISISAQPAGYPDWQSYVQGLDSLSGIESVPAFYALKSALGNAGIAVIAVTAIAAVVSSIIGFYRASARLLMNMAEDHILSERFNKPSVCFLFLMGISMVISLFGRTALSWVVDLSSFGAIIGFAYVSAAVFHLGRKSDDRRMRRMGMAGIVLTIGFAAAQLIPRISLIETMKAESYLLLAFWCLLGFVFYWRTMRIGSRGEQRNAGITIAALAFLLIFSIVIWYIKKMLPSEGRSATPETALGYSVMLLLVILLGLAVMLLIHSRLRRRQMRLETERIRAIENSQAKSRFLFNMSHDIRTPMNAVLGYAGLALKEPLSPVVRDYLEKIELSGHHMLSLINDILEMSRIESGKMELKEVPADLNLLFEEIIHLFSEQMKRKRIRFSVDASGLKEPFVYCDRKYLVRVLLNLISNAYKFTPEGGSIEVSALDQRTEDPELRAVEIRVKDSGIGMSEEFAGRMFTAFERERTSTDSGVEGTGLGLAITKSIVDLMEGEIGVKTAPGEGTEMIIRLKLRTADPAEIEQNECTMEEISRETGDCAEQRLLVVEDNAINMEIVCMILEQAGYELETAENGKIAVEMVANAEACCYDAVLMDIQMPVMDGYTASREIRALQDPLKSRIPIIALTANAFDEDVQRSREAGMDAHLSKPVDPEALLRTLQELIGSGREG